VAAYLGRHSFGYSDTVVAEALGYRGPSTVSHAVRRIEAGSKTLRRTVRQLDAALK
jgi:chromosomal replication initiation ATPase DnaA